jgi:TPR repeat protein
MSHYRPSPALNRQYPDCPGCGRDLAGLDRAIFCPGCGKQLQFKITVRQRVAEASKSLLGSLTFGRFGREPAAPVDTGTDRAPILIGYGKAMFNLGWRYERGSLRNLSEAIRCYRKSARLGNPDAKVRLAADESKPREPRTIER